jgi:hypothetical protein
VASPIPEAPPVTSAASPANSVDCSAIHRMYHIGPVRRRSIVNLVAGIG